MSKTFNTNTANHDEWLTPPHIIAALGQFDLDPCSPIHRPWETAKHHYTILDDGLAQPWFGRVWCNPPYGRETFKWLNKLASHGSGFIARALMLTAHEYFDTQKERIAREMTHDFQAAPDYDWSE